MNVILLLPSNKPDLNLVGVAEGDNGAIQQLKRLKYCFDYEFQDEDNLAEKLKERIRSYNTVADFIFKYKLPVQASFFSSLCEVNSSKERHLIISWALAYACTDGDWYKERLEKRIESSIVVSALLLTITVDAFLNPPGQDSCAISSRLYAFVSGILSVILLVSIIYGSFFVENSICRPYGKEERLRMVLIQYRYRSLSIMLSSWAAALFPIFLATRVYDNYPLSDAIIFAVALGLLSYFLIRGYFLAQQEVSSASISKYLVSN